MPEPRVLQDWPNILFCSIVLTVVSSTACYAHSVLCAMMNLDEYCDGDGMDLIFLVAASSVETCQAKLPRGAYKVSAILDTLQGLSGLSRDMCFPFRGLFCCCFVSWQDPTALDSATCPGERQPL